MITEIGSIRERITEYGKIRNDKRFSIKNRVNANLKMRFYQNKLSNLHSKQPTEL